MRTFEDPRYAELLGTVADIARPHLESLGLAAADPEPYRPYLSERSPIEGRAIDALGTVPDEAVPAVRIALLRRIAESGIGTPGSSHGVAREKLAGRGPALGADELALELALCRFAMDLGFGVSLGWMRAALLDRTLDDLDRMGPAAITQELRAEAEALIVLLANDTLSTDPAATDRRFRLILFVQRVSGSALPASAFDTADAFGEAMAAMVGSDPDLARGLGFITPLAAKATSVLPVGHQRALIAALAGGEHGAEARAAVLRCLQRLLTAPLTPRGPGFVTVRPSNQRLGRAAIWALPALSPDSAAALLGELGVRLGTSSKRDNQARDAAMANTCAALLGELDTDEAAASLARMLARVRNKPVRKQVEKALAAVAERAGVEVDQLVDRSLPSHGVDAEGRRVLHHDTWAAEVDLGPDGKVRVSWSDGSGEPHDEAPRSLRDRAPGEVADVVTLADDIRSTLSDERHRLERSLADGRRWSVGEWRRRFLEHPLGRVHARRLVWRFTAPSGVIDALPTSSELMDDTGEPVPLPPDDATVELWHPIEASDEAVDRWRDLIVTGRVIQPFKQVFRETYHVEERSGTDGVLDTRFAERPLAYGQMRALMGARGWTTPMLGPFDQGDRSVAFRDFTRAGLRAELLHVPAGLGDPRERVEYVRSGSVRFTVGTDDRRSPVLLSAVPPRPFSEALRDVELFTSVPELMRDPRSSADADGSPSVATRADAMRRLLPTLPYARQASVLGLWLTVDGAAGAFAISFVSAAVVRLPDEETVEVDVPESLPGLGYVPFDDDVLSLVLAKAKILLDRRS